MADAPKRVYWDSCAWIGFINKEPGKATPLRVIWKDAEQGKYEIWTSVYSYLEVIHGIVEHGAPYSAEEYDEVIFSLFGQAHVKRIQVSEPIAKLARLLKRKHHPDLGKRPDAIHLASAAYSNCTELHTWDKSDLLHLNGKVLRRDGEKLGICVPGTEAFGPLFAEPQEEEIARGPASEDASTAEIHRDGEELREQRGRGGVPDGAGQDSSPPAGNGAAHQDDDQAKKETSQGEANQRIAPSPQPAGAAPSGPANEKGDHS